MSNSDKQKLIDRYLVAYNSFDIGGMLALLSPDVRFENYSGGQLTTATSGLYEFKQLAEQSKALFSEREQRITKLTLNLDSALLTLPTAVSLPLTYQTALQPEQSLTCRVSQSFLSWVGRSARSLIAAECTPNNSVRDFRSTPGA